MSVKLLTEHHSEFLSLKGGCTGSSESTFVKMKHCWKSHAATQMTISGNVRYFRGGELRIEEGGNILTKRIWHCMSHHCLYLYKVERNAKIRNGHNNSIYMMLDEGGFQKNAAKV